MDEKKNWWVTEYNRDKSISYEWLLPDCLEHDAIGIVEAVVDNTTFELDDGSCVQGWSMRIAVITIETKSGCVYDVLGLPDGWDYDVVDEDDKEEREHDRGSE